MNKLISIIIPTFNRAHLILHTLESIKNQTYNEWECIIVDDGSTDNTEDVLKKYIDTDSRFRYFKRPLNHTKGPSSCRNFGFYKSTGAYIKWFDSDDILLPDALEKQISYMDDEVDVVVSKLELKNLEKNETIEVNEIFSNLLIEDYLLGNVSFYVSGPLWKREFLVNKELFDEKIRNLDDWDFNLRMMYNKPHIFFLDEVIAIYRIHEDSLLHELGKCNFNEIYSEFSAREKHLKLLSSLEYKKARLKLRDFIIARSLFFLRIGLSLPFKEKCKLFLITLKYQMKYQYHRIFFKTLLAFFTSIIFNKGYTLLK